MYRGYIVTARGRVGTCLTNQRTSARAEPFLDAGVRHDPRHPRLGLVHVSCMLRCSTPYNEHTTLEYVRSWLVDCETTK